MTKRSAGEVQIINAAKHLFLTKGYHRVSTTEIIKEAGVAKGTLYHHFPSKDHLAVAVIGEILKDEIDAFLSIDFTREDSQKRLTDFLFHLAKDARKREGSMMLLFQLTTAITNEDASLELENVISEMFMETISFGEQLGITDENLLNVFLALIDGFVIHVWLRPKYYTDAKIMGFIKAALSLLPKEVE
ncbi:MAG: TetR/AcrR family transcriptional regulator [Methanobacteriota archaeon]|nr:MAG: TetR/AcrR family transcriptional regulator [Euryarchaeota archaeon]